MEPRSCRWARRVSGDVAIQSSSVRWSAVLPYPLRVSTPQPVGEHRVERVLAFMVAAIIGLSIAAFLAVMIGTLLGAVAIEGFSTGIWTVVLVLPLVGLPIGFLLLVALLIINGVRRARESRQGSA